MGFGVGLVLDFKGSSCVTFSVVFGYGFGVVVLFLLLSKCAVGTYKSAGGLSG